jgi:enoyl-CoA hydratase/carnithine racemase
MADDIAPVLIDQREDGRVWVITMNRPQRANALGGGMRAALLTAFTRFRDDPVARVAILTGAGDKAFCAGLDLKEAAAGSAGGGGTAGDPANRSARGDLFPLAEGLELWKPVIAAINGYAVAGGFALAMQCDIRIMAEHARAGIAEARWNMGGAGWMAPLTRQMTLGAAIELALWADTQYTAQRCYEIGWAQRVVPASALMPTALEYASRMLTMAPRAVRNIKQMLYRGAYLEPMEAFRVGAWLEQNLAGMDDSAEGPRAFAEKRDPEFTDT